MNSTRTYHSDTVSFVLFVFVDCDSGYCKQRKPICALHCKQRIESDIKRERAKYATVCGRVQFFVIKKEQQMNRKKESSTTNSRSSSNHHNNNNSNWIWMPMHMRYNSRQMNVSLAWKTNRKRFHTNSRKAVNKKEMRRHTLNFNEEQKKKKWQHTHIICLPCAVLRHIVKYKMCPWTRMMYFWVVDIFFPCKRAFFALVKFVSAVCAMCLYIYGFFFFRLFRVLCPLYVCLCLDAFLCSLFVVVVLFSECFFRYCFFFLFQRFCCFLPLLLPAAAAISLECVAYFVIISMKPMIIEANELTMVDSFKTFRQVDKILKYFDHRPNVRVSRCFRSIWIRRKRRTK